MQQIFLHLLQKMKCKQNFCTLYKKSFYIYHVLLSLELLEMWNFPVLEGQIMSDHDWKLEFTAQEMWLALRNSLVILFTEFLGHVQKYCVSKCLKNLIHKKKVKSVNRH